MRTRQKTSRRKQLRRFKLKKETIKESRELLFRKQQGCCWYCKRLCYLPSSEFLSLNAADDTFTLDHIVPASHGGSNKRGNLVGACAQCNREKADISFSPELIDLVKRLRHQQPSGRQVAWKPWIDPVPPSCQRVAVDFAIDVPALLPSALAWAEEETRRGFARGRSLYEWEIGMARHLGVAWPELIRIVVVNSLPTPMEAVLRAAVVQMGLLRAAGLTVGHTIFVRNTHLPRARVLSHEFVHVRQWEQAGSSVKYLRCYFEQLVEHGYQDAPMEMEARAEEMLGWHPSQPSCCISTLALEVAAPDEIEADELLGRDCLSRGNPNVV